MNSRALLPLSILWLATTASAEDRFHGAVEADCGAFVSFWRNEELFTPEAAAYFEGLADALRIASDEDGWFYLIAGEYEQECRKDPSASVLEVARRSLVNLGFRPPNPDEE